MYHPNETTQNLLVFLYDYRIAYARDLAKWIGYSLTITQRYLKELEDNGLITKQQFGNRFYWGILDGGIDYLSKNFEYEKKETTDTTRILESDVEGYARHEALVTKTRVAYMELGREHSIETYGAEAINGVLSPVVAKRRGENKLKYNQVRLPEAWGDFAPYEFDDVILIENKDPEIHFIEVNRTKHRTIRSAHGDLKSGTITKKIHVFNYGLESGYFDRVYGSEFKFMLRIILADNEYASAQRQTILNVYDEITEGR